MYAQSFLEKLYSRIRSKIPFFCIVIRPSFNTEYTLFTACVNIYNDQYCELHLGNCWRQSTAPKLVKNCRKTCVCKCCQSTPVTLPTTPALFNTTTVTNASTARQTTAATISYSTTITGEERTTTMRPQTTHTSSGTEGIFKDFLCSGFVTLPYLVRMIFFFAFLIAVAGIGFWFKTGCLI